MLNVSFDMKLGCGFKYVLFAHLLGEMIQFHSYFSDGWLNHQLEGLYLEDHPS